MGLPSRMVSSLHVPPLFWQGQVKARLESGQFEVDCGERCWIVPQAVSCLVQPQVGDKVWVGGADGEQAYVFAVLERPQAATGSAQPRQAARVTTTSTAGPRRLLHRPRQLE